MKLDVKAFGLACGIIWAVAVFLCGLVCNFGWCEKFVELMGSIYIGYDKTIVGSLIGLVWGFFDGLIGGILFALLYNFLVKEK